ncbi:integrase [Methanolobus sp. ZRKC3]|uniref:integrase n=1 Tax=Methanolobus sp. ZRKC3 TaxID=3125786 RepID=UPI00324E638B
MPQSYAALIGDNAHVFETEYNGKPLFLVSLDEDIDENLVVQPAAQATLESRFEAVEKQLSLLQKSLSEESQNKSNGPAESRTPDLRRVKVSVASNRFLHAYGMNDCQSMQCQELFPDLQSFWQSHSVEFKEWLKHRDVSEQTKKGYINALVKFFQTNTICKPNEFRKLDLKDKESRGLRNLFNYCEDEEIDDVCGFSVDKWRRFIKIRKSGVTEVYITDEEVQKAHASCPEDVKIVFKLLVSSGSRLSHLYQMLQSFDENKVVTDGEIAHYPTSEFSSGNKRTFQIFFPTAYISEIKSFHSSDHYKTLTKKLQAGRVSAKTIRKWHLNVMIKEGVTESLADFIQGRAPATVGSAHYLNKVEQAKNEYRRILRKFSI